MTSILNFSRLKFSIPKKQTNMLHLYVFKSFNTNTENEDLFKMGHHTGGIKKLRNRYLTPHPNMDVRLFYKTQNAIAIENIIKNRYKQERVLNDNGNLSEWYKLSSEKIINDIFKEEFRINEEKRIAQKYKDLRLKSINLSLRKQLSLEVKSSIDKNQLTYIIRIIREPKRNLRILFTDVDIFKSNLRVRMKDKNYTGYTVKDIIDTLT
jgi:hypothetical protein